MSLLQLGARRAGLQQQRARPLHAPASSGPSPRRLRVLSYNLGGMCTTTHDTFMCWLAEQGSKYDVVMLQETQYGLGKEFTEYTVPGWSAISSPDPSHRWAGVATYISHRIAAPEDIRYHVIARGRILRVRTPVGKGNRSAHIDLVNVYKSAARSGNNWEAGSERSAAQCAECGR